MEGLEFESYYLYIFAKNKLNTSELVLMTVEKSDGTQLKTTIKEMNSSVTCLKMQLCLSAASSHMKAANPKYKLLVGCADGFLKILYMEKPYFLEEVRIDHKAVVCIQEGNYQLFNHQNICMVLTTDSQVHFIDIDESHVIYILRPQILMSDSALSLAIHPMYTHLLQSTEGGYLIFW